MGEIASAGFLGVIVEGDPVSESAISTFLAPC